MSKGKYGTSMNAIEHIKKANRIPCDCERCRHSRRGAGTLYCELRDANGIGAQSPCQRTARRAKAKNQRTNAMQNNRANHCRSYNDIIPNGNMHIAASYAFSSQVWQPTISL